MNEEGIKEFFEGVKRLQKENELDIRDLDNFFSQLRFRLDIFQTTKKQTDVYLASNFNVFDYIRPDENRLSDIIKELLDPNGSHGQRGLFLKEFLKFTKDPDIFRTENVEIIRENTTKYIIQDQRRIDIKLDFNSGKYGIGIENKPWAGDQKDQIKNYSENFEREYKGKYFLTYLSRDGSPPSHESIDTNTRLSLEDEGKFGIISYPSEFKTWLESCYKECRAEKVRWFLRDFIEYVERNFRIRYMD